MRLFKGVGIIMAVVFLLAGAALAAANPEENNPDHWGDSCFKIEWEGDVRQYVADANYSLIVIKAGTVNYEFRSVTKGDVLELPKGISHIVFCEEEEWPTTTTTVLETTTSTGPTTTIISTTTTTTLSSTTSTTTVMSTTSTTPPTSVTTTVPPTTFTTVAPSTPNTLPYTGSRENTIAFAAFGALLLITGMACIAAYRGDGTKDE